MDNVDPSAANPTDRGPDEGELRAGALRGEPNHLAAYSRRLELVPKLLAAWNERLEEPIGAEELAELAGDASIALWQDLPQFTAAEPLDHWLARRTAQLLHVDTDEDALEVLAAAHTVDAAPGQSLAREKLARFRAEQKMRPAPVDGGQRPLWAVIGVLGVIATFLAVSPYSPFRNGESLTLPSPDVRQAPRADTLPSAKLTLVEPLRSTEQIEAFRWEAPEGVACTLVVEDIDGKQLIRTTGIRTGTFVVQQPLPPGVLRWQVSPDDPASDLRPTRWMVLQHASTAGSQGAEFQAEELPSAGSQEAETQDE